MTSVMMSPRQMTRVMARESSLFGELHGHLRGEAGV
jgi:hypothetical protein